MPYLEYDKVDEKTAMRMKTMLEKSYAGYWKKKRTFDVVMTALLLFFLLLPMLLCALIIFLDDPHGSPLYRQTRIGRHGKPFCMYKFRSMHVNAEAHKETLWQQNEMDGPVFKIKDDPRITRVGRVMRKCSIDELPQLFNVLVGNMSLVGPRPPLPEEVAAYTDYEKLRLLVTPGLTCTWQITENRNDMSFDKWVEMDLAYIENRTTWLDIAILAKTPGAMLKATGR